MSRNIEMNYKTDTAYEPLYPQTTCDMVIDLLNIDTKSLMGLPSTATGDDAFRELFLAIVLDGRALINFTVMGDDGTPCKGVQIESSAFCDSNGNLTPTVETNDEGKVSVFCNSTSVAVSVKNYFDLEDWSHTYTVVFGEQYEETITLTRRNFLKLTSSVSKKFSSAVVRVDVTAVGGGGGGTNGGSSGEGADYSFSRGGGGGGYCVIQEKISFTIDTLISVTVGSGGSINGNGGNSSFSNVIAEGGKAGEGDFGGVGNGNGGDGVDSDDPVPGNNGSPGTVYGYSSFTETVLYGGGGGSGSTGGSDQGGKGAGYGGDGGYRISGRTGVDATAGANGYGGGGGSGAYWVYGTDGENTMSAKGGSGCVALRMYTQSTLPA